jgi:hypothetical protein
MQPALRSNEVLDLAPVIGCERTPIITESRAPLQDRASHAESNHPDCISMRQREQRDTTSRDSSCRQRRKV